MKKALLLACLLMIGLTSCVASDFNVTSDFNNTQSTFSEECTAATDTQKDGKDTVDITQGESEEVFEKYTLYVNNIKLESDNHMVINKTYNYAVLPLIKILRSLGATVEWIEKGKAIIVYDDETYVLNALEYSLTLKNTEYDCTNYIALAPGSAPGYYEMIEDDYLVGSKSVILFFDLIGVKIDIDYVALKVSIKNLEG